MTFSGSCLLVKPFPGLRETPIVSVSNGLPKVLILHFSFFSYTALTARSCNVFGSVLDETVSLSSLRAVLENEND